MQIALNNRVWPSSENAKKHSLIQHFCKSISKALYILKKTHCTKLLTKKKRHAHLFFGKECMNQLLKEWFPFVISQLVTPNSHTVGLPATPTISSLL